MFLIKICGHILANIIILSRFNVDPISRDSHRALRFSGPSMLFNPVEVKTVAYPVIQMLSLRLALVSSALSASTSIMPLVSNTPL